jgi:hypothetical protein
MFKRKIISSKIKKENISFKGKSQKKKKKNYKLFYKFWCEHKNLLYNTQGELK